MTEILRGTVQAMGRITGRVCCASFMPAQTYEGPYAVTPTLQVQTLLTAKKVMGQNVTIKEIPIVAVSNTAGGNTVIIG